ncbi:SDR family NAD(P)-dependent oxidoreductase [Anoxybacillus sp. J5B_2022]|uniref:SDR family NAD(P)-dependent oxidoreductase n=1 Tax=Anoxybacillus sp. J5B_2022 TaxID=3003246 RepID=UPI002285A67F|nr:SDR family oxidoreductase [Anoxybacillus sp. J5B_2022]MCZ0755026.1 SDR family oxidoreductase [Anoxybacillus sp. J5B_2022]
MYQGKVVVITGAAGGIGRALAKAYAEQGATIIVTDKTDEAQLVAKRLQTEGYDVHSYICDLTVPTEIENMFREIDNMFRRVDVLINNAGFGIFVSPYDLTVEQWDDVINTNLRGAFLCAREAAKIMKTHGGGAIVNIASTRALMSEPNSEAYAASKGGMLALTHALAMSFSADRIRVNAICPGWIETKAYETLRPKDHAQHPAGRVGKPEDVARACLYFTDPNNDFVTGTHLVVDGGMTRKMIYEE